MAPLLLSLQLLPQVSTATTSVLGLLSSSSSLLHYALLPATTFSSTDTSAADADLSVMASWGCLLFVLGALGGLGGRGGSVLLMEALHRPSLLLLFLCLTLLLSLLWTAYDLSVSSFSFALHSFCE